MYSWLVLICPQLIRHTIETDVYNEVTLIEACVMDLFERFTTIVSSHNTPFYSTHFLQLVISTLPYFCFDVKPRGNRVTDSLYHCSQSCWNCHDYLAVLEVLLLIYLCHMISQMSFFTTLSNVDIIQTEWLHSIKIDMMWYTPKFTSSDVRQPK